FSCRWSLCLSNRARRYHHAFGWQFLLHAACTSRLLLSDSRRFSDHRGGFDNGGLRSSLCGSLSLWLTGTRLALWLFFRRSFCVTSGSGFIRGRFCCNRRGFSGRRFLGFRNLLAAAALGL